MVAGCRQHQARRYVGGCAQLAGIAELCLGGHRIVSTVLFGQGTRPCTVVSHNHPCSCFKVDGIDVDRMGRCSARQETVNPAPYNGAHNRSRSPRYRGALANDRCRYTMLPDADFPRTGKWRRIRPVTTGIPFYGQRPRCIC